MSFLEKNLSSISVLQSSQFSLFNEDPQLGKDLVFDDSFYVHIEPLKRVYRSYSSKYGVMMSWFHYNNKTKS